MKNTLKVLSVRVFGIIAFVAVIGFTMIACNKSGGSSGGGGKTLNSPEALKEYLDSQPANSPDKPIKVSMTINDPMFKSVERVINNAGKYVSLNISGNVLTTIPESAFQYCETLISITIPDSVTKIEVSAFEFCKNLTSVTFKGTIDSHYINGFGYSFPGDLRKKYLAGGIGTYTTTAPVNNKSVYTKQ